MTTAASHRERLVQEVERCAQAVGLNDLLIFELEAVALLLGEARIRVLPGRAVPTLERAELIRRVRTAMADAPPEDLTVEELRVVLAVVEGAADTAPRLWSAM